MHGVITLSLEYTLYGKKKKKKTNSLYIPLTKLFN